MSVNGNIMKERVEANTMNAWLATSVPGKRKMMKKIMIEKTLHKHNIV